MSKIQVMNEILANKIAAGEVVEKTMNVVKELVENSIDAKATEITIKLIDSGVKEVEVADNGTGMDEEDAKMAFLRHATSKLKNLDDLFYIESLGFRGEALPSIASVSNVVLKTSDGKVGTLVKISGGKDMTVERCDLQEGTTIKVQDLFYNTPVRLKYLKNLYIELANIVEYVNKMALSYPNIKFKLINNDKELLSTDGNGDLLKVIYQIYGIQVAKKMIPVEGENDDYYISGYVSFPEITKSNRNSITTLVNGRVIKNNELNKTIIDCYHTYIHKDRYPIIVLNIDVDPILVDINIHPTKMDIKFSKMDTLKELIINIITKRLEEATLIPDAATRDLHAINEVRHQIIEKETEINKTPEAENQAYEEMQLDFEIAEEQKKYAIKETKSDEVKEEIVDAKHDDYNRIKKMYPKAVIFMTYIVAENDDGMYLIDQHAAAERINYEKILKAMKEKPIIVDLLVPVKIELRNDEFIIAKTHFDLLEQYGFKVEDFGFNTILVRTHPNWIPEEKAEELIRKVVDIICEKGSFDFDQFIWRIAATTACRMSVMAGDYISLEEQQWILDNVRKCENPFTCPHGRPTIITYTRYELERLFKRQLD